MKIYIRADASVEIGSGHIIRCLTLADRLKPKADIAFICQELQGNLISYIRSRGYSVGVLPPTQGSWQTDAEFTMAYVSNHSSLTVDWLIVDHYGLDARFEAMLNRHVKRVMVIDDLADRPHQCDLLLDQNPYENGEKRYLGLVKSSTTLLLGPEYALLKPEFTGAKTHVSRRSGEVRNVLVSFGGADHTGETVKTLQSLEQLQQIVEDKLCIKVLIGKINAQAERIHTMCARLNNTECYGHVEDVASFMKEADLAIGSGGTTTWERCCLGLPAIVIITADNQMELSEYAARLGVITLLGRAEQVQIGHIRDKVLEFMRNTQQMTMMSEKGFQLVDGLGADRTVEELLIC
ncbi:UDP-2,4-diacetamido-2,4,6-trideoxy-beta-L-altropyranose hydrolase [Cohnella abietis]|uniref:UDP-2,4-diacetamido-2,4,6-trideoxy-beta-L-altropy ranose hydrolase n=1 Tax=Cohnella abietis TaxID=2507935 RepID=A0A3T1D146_9BACL|nr:UDP-2,4-diacetamido-2,4,6-trideoxy-beta-L-altropyranose hydrolase [Cohnella abietis]BBI31781.1 UDP-2,4-diacetamido-2,4,6-trideoxy-beta-L-altropy ranose hydrolase [Cohnella abietis]